MDTEVIVYGYLEVIVAKNEIWCQKQGVHHMTNTMMRKLLCMETSSYDIS